MRISPFLVAVGMAALALPISSLAASVPAAPLDAALADAECGPVPLVADPSWLDLGIGLGGDGEPELHACFGKIRPGGRMTAPVGCTMNWVFRDDLGQLYIGTAGHCLGSTGSTGREVGMWGIGRIGESAYVINGGVGRDFGLVKIDADKHHLVDPTLCHWGGPSKLGEHGTGPMPTELLQYGFGVGFGFAAATRARVHVTHNAGQSAITIDGAISSGDSGSPVMYADGGAAGVVTHAMAGVPGLFAMGPGYAQRLDVGIALAEAATGRTFTLVTSDVDVEFPLGTDFPALGENA